MIVKVDIRVNRLVRLGKDSRFMSVNTLCFEDGEEIFHRGVIIWIYCLLDSSLVRHNAIVVQIADHLQIQYTLLGMDIGCISS